LRTFAIFLLMALAALTISCPKPPDAIDASNPAVPAKPLKEAVYRFPLPADPPTLDPMHVTDTVSDTVVRRVFNGLTYRLMA
jgi:ABC-type oligopeptide transport system substrate-binding subunit